MSSVISTELPTLATSPAMGSRVSARRALVVENEPGMCALIQDVLGSVDIEARHFVTSADADGKFQEEKFDVVIQSISTPPNDGCELIRKIRGSGLNQKTPIIVISNDLSPMALTRSFDAGANFFVYKPLDRARLVSLLRATRGTIDHEIRRFRRVPVQMKVRLKSDKVSLDGETIDVSLNGMLIKAPHTLPIRTRLGVSLFLHERDEPVVGLGTVVRVQSDTNMGILLDGLSAKETGRLQEYLLPLMIG
jgi:DNA-binding response OmpR family regulator